jgi:hypothetical protein
LLVHFIDTLLDVVAQESRIDTAIFDTYQHPKFVERIGTCGPLVVTVPAPSSSNQGIINNFQIRQ